MFGRKIRIKPVSPFYRHYPVIVKGFIKADFFKISGVFDTIKVDVKKGVPARIFIDQGIRRTGYIIAVRNTKTPGQSLYKDGFSASEIAEEGDNCAG